MDSIVRAVQWARTLRTALARIEAYDSQSFSSPVTDRGDADVEKLEESAVAVEEFIAEEQQRREEELDPEEVAKRVMEMLQRDLRLERERSA